MDMLIQCQDAAQQVGNYLETLSGGGPIVSLLEEYCENLYLMSRSIKNSTRYLECSIIIEKQLSSIRKEISHRLPDEKWEIVFLPYKASMWDSLESVWRAASRDEQCDVYVVPIPYFEKYSNGTFGY